MTAPRIPRAHPIIGDIVRARRAEAADDSGWPTTQQYPRESSNDAPFADEGPSPRTDWAELLLRAAIVAVFVAIVVWHAVARHGAPQ